MDDQQFNFRVVLVKIQKSLSDDDRKQLHFLFGEDIPRVLQENSSLGSALEALQKLFDNLKISPNNYDYLVRALEAIQRHDCAQRLREYDSVVPKDIRQFLSPEGQQNTTGASAPQQTSASHIPKLSDILDDLTDVDAVRSATVLFNPPEPSSIDFDNVDLRPFEEPSCEWTEAYSNSLALPYHPRGYQIEIIRDAIRNRQTIVSLRTGSGKTFIAAVLIKYYYIKKQKEQQPNSKFSTLFFVPRKAIRLQQAKAISDIGNLRVQLCDDDQTVDQLISTNHVIVTTPQKFVNCLKNGSLRLSQLDLMIFDECHNTSGANPYCEIMKFYLCPSRGQNTNDRPKIIGLTATVSSKDAAENKEAIEKNLVTLCSKLACQDISTVCTPENLDEINREISRPTNNQFEFVQPVQFNRFHEEYLNMVNNLIEQIKQHLDNRELLDGQEIGSSSFIGQLVLLKQGFEGKGSINNIIICNYLLLLTKKYSALKDLPFHLVIQYIAEQMNDYHQGFQVPSLMDNILYERCNAELVRILEQHAQHPADNPKLDRLVDLLQRHASATTKGLVLTKTTFYVKTICDYLSTHPALQNTVKPTWVVGQNSSDFALTIHEQETRLRQFRGDERNVLVASDIVQEGLDIPQCSYVIRYEFVSDAIGTIQSRGRARAQNSSYYLITELESINHHRELNNKIREENMDRAVATWPTLDKDIFHRDVASKTKTLITDWEREIQAELQQRAILQHVGRKEGGICCRTCDRVLGQLAWLRKRKTSYFINNAEFFARNECRLNQTFKDFQENRKMGKVKCTCGNDLGGCLKFLDRPELGTVCALSCDKIKFQLEGQPVFFLFSQWSKNDRFDIEELEEF